MTATPEQIVAASKANVEAGLKSASAFVTTVFTAAERVATLNLATARTAFDDSVAFSKAVMATKDPKALAALSLGAMTPAVEKSVAYGRSLSVIGGDTQEELTKLVEAEAAALGKNFDTALEGLFKNAPAGSETAVAMMKSAVAAANNAFESVQKAVKQASDVAEANFNAVATSATNVAKTATAKKR